VYASGNKRLVDKKGIKCDKIKAANIIWLFSLGWENKAAIYEIRTLILRKFLFIESTDFSSFVNFYTKYSSIINMQNTGRR
jgi:hypothetical protein